MKSFPEPKIDSADRIHDGLLITFEDGKCAIFSHALMRETLAKAGEVSDVDDATLDESEFDCNQSTRHLP